MKLKILFAFSFLLELTCCGQKAKIEWLVPISLPYYKIGNFVEGLAPVESGKFGFINEKGTLIIPFNYDEVKYFSEGYASVKMDNKWGYINLKGEVVIPFKYSSAGSFSNGKANVSEERESKKAYESSSTIYEIIDKTGKTVDKVSEFETLTRPANGLQVVSKEYKYGFADTNNILKIPIEFDEVNEFFENNITTVKKGDKWFIIDGSGNEIVEIKKKYDQISFFTDGLCLVCNKDPKGTKGLNEMLCGFINKTGKETIPLQFQFAFPFEDGMAIAGKHWRRGFINKNGEIVIPFYYQDINMFSNGLASFKKSDEWGYLDKNGNEVIKNRYQKVGPFTNGFAKASLDGYKWGIINKKEDVILPFEYSIMSDISNKPILVQKDNLWGIFKIITE